MAEFATLQHATYTEAEWTAWDGVLLEGQMAYSSDVLYSGTDQMRHKVGNGTDTWTALDYVPEPSGFTGGNLTSALNEAKGADIASAATTDIGAATGNFVHVTGTTTITALGTVQAGARRTVRFAGALTLTHNATSLILPTGANITTAANDVATFVSEGSGNWRCVGYLRADGSALVGGSKKSQTIYFTHSTLSPADGLNYFFAVPGSTAATATGVLRRKFAMLTGYIYEIVCHISISTTLGTTEQATIKLNNKTAGTSVTITTVAQYDAVGQTYTLTLGSPFAITKWDSLEIEVNMPTFATNPVGVIHYVEALAMES